MSSICNVAILIATYNGEKYICQQFDSIMAQTYSDFVCYIHDDGSTDGTMKIIESYKKKYPEKIVTVSGAPTGGARSNFYYLLNAVNADYYLFCDQDDWWYPQKISVMVEKMKSLESEEGDRPYYIFSDLEVADENLGLIAHSYMRYTGRDTSDLSVEHILFRNFAPGCASIINDELKKMMLSVDNLEDTFMHDWWGLLVALCFGKSCFIDEPLVKYRQHGKNELGAEKYISVSKVKSLSTKAEAIRGNIEKAYTFSMLLKKISGKVHIDIPEVDYFLDSQCDGKGRKIRYFWKNRHHFSAFAALCFILFC